MMHIPLASFDAFDESLTWKAVGCAALVFLFLYFKRSISREAKERKELAETVAHLVSVTNNNSQFIAGVATASMAGPTVSSSLIHDLHEQYKPSDASGTWKPIPRPRK